MQHHIGGNSAVTFEYFFNSWVADLTSAAVFSTSIDLILFYQNFSEDK
jgi:hypothetical protein